MYVVNTHTDILYTVSHSELSVLLGAMVLYNMELNTNYNTVCVCEIIFAMLSFSREARRNA